MWCAIMASERVVVVIVVVVVVVLLARRWRPEVDHKIGSQGG